ncbi:preprotein translocase subunit SecY [Anaerobutyricum soehngenii]|uniref:preprotein translocase subunit SecY n=1 Tax=Anaerobutyricum soehngenii TaxID=105843 RepID=UPI001ADD78AA|nr:preprotein translocase subunit SecY [Anaerobutyricum soehngenii]MBP0061065.1 preprotein translocase subunit SecY [Anaerobutyricum soehngenii]
MFETLRNALKVKDIRKRLLFTLVVLVICRLGSQLPIPGIDTDTISQYLNSLLGDSFNLLNSFTGGSFESMSLFALNVTPYITASIIIQLLTIAIPALEELYRDGEDGRKKINNITRFVTLALSVLESAGLAIDFGKQGLLSNYGPLIVIEMIVCLTAGSVFVMWLGEQITDKGVGNGISIILLCNIVSRMPSDLFNLYQKFMEGKQISNVIIAGVIIFLVILGTIIFTIVLNDAERRIPVQYSRKIQGGSQLGGLGSTLPVKVNTANVMPIIFSSSLLQFPLVIKQLVGANPKGTAGFIFNALNQSNWCNPDHWNWSIGLIIYLLLNVVFAYFYTSITFNPLEISNNMKKQGGYIPGVRPGKATVDYLNSILTYIIFIGAIGLCIVAVIPIFFNGFFGANVSFGGTSIIIIAGVVLETMKQIESQTLVRQYTGFLTE